LDGLFKRFEPKERPSLKSVFGGESSSPTHSELNSPEEKKEKSNIKKKSRK